MSGILFFLIIALILFIIIKWIYIFLRDYKRIVFIYNNSSPKEDETLFLISNRIIQKYNKRIFISVIIIILLFIYLFMYYRAEVMGKKSYTNIDYLLPAIIIIIITLFVLYLVLNFLRIKPEDLKNKYRSPEVLSDEETSEKEINVEEAITEPGIKGVLLKLIATEGNNISENYRWLYEQYRWTELVFTILAQFVPLDYSDIRQIIEQMATRGLIDLKSLSATRFNNTQEIDNNQEANKIKSFLLEVGFTEDLAKRSVRCICEVATGLGEHYNGKIQYYIRSYGEQLLKDLPNKFRFSQLNNDEVRNAFIYWMQNVLDMPIPINIKAIKEFAEINNVTFELLITEADNLDINLSYLDDMIQLNKFNAKNNE